MPRHCRTCGTKHGPPTGKGCTKVATSSPTDQSVLNQVLAQLGAQLQQVNTRLDKLESNDEPPEDDQDAPDAAIAAAVRSRMADLNLLHDHTDAASSDDETTSKKAHKTKGKKSGRARTADDIVIAEIDWPHYYIYRGTERRPAKYSELTVAEFVLGYLSSMEKETTSVQAHMKKHLLELMRDTMDFSWDSVRNFHGVLLNQFEMRRITWEDTEEIQALRRAYAHRVIAQANTDQIGDKPTTSRNTNVRGPIFCVQFQTGECKSHGDHASPRGQVQHICAYCLKETGCSFNHAEQDCRRKSASTNEEL